MKSTHPTPKGHDMDNPVIEAMKSRRRCRAFKTERVVWAQEADR